MGSRYPRERADSRGFPKPFGQENTAWLYGVLTAEELEYLYTLDGAPATIYTLAKWPIVGYANYNVERVHLVRPTDDQWRGGFWTNIVQQFLQCEVIP